MKNLNLLNLVIRRGSGASLNLFRYAAMVFVLLTLGVGNGWAKYSYARMTVKAGATGAGLIYGSACGADPGNHYTTSDLSVDDGYEGGSKAHTYYMWAMPKRGSVFTGWSCEKTEGNKFSGPTQISGENYRYISITSPATPSSDGTVYTTVVATAQWNTYDAAKVTFQSPSNGSYEVEYSYTDYNETTKLFYDDVVSFAMQDGAAARQEDLYKTDVVILKTTAPNFAGWYSDAETPLPGSYTSKTYTYEAPDGGTASVYAKFNETTKYYGKVTVQLASNSAEDGGKFYISEYSTLDGAVFSDASQSVTQSSYSQTVESSSAIQTYFLTAQPTDPRYKFRGWYSTADGSGNALSTEMQFAYEFSASSTDAGDPSEVNVYACFERTSSHFLKVDALPASSGLGMVHVIDAKYDEFPNYLHFTNVASQTVIVNASNATTNGTAYLYALPKYGYKFDGWYINASCTGGAVSTANPYTFSAPAASTDPLLPTKHVFYAKFVTDQTFSVTYTYPTNGKYEASVLDIVEEEGEYVWGQTKVYVSDDYTADAVVTSYKTDYLMLSATPNNSYNVTEWNDGGTKTATAERVHEAKLDKAKTVGVTFGQISPFKVGNATFAELEDAISAAVNGSTKKIIVVENAYVKAGNYTIPQGVTLLVPYNADYSEFTTMNKGNSQVDAAPTDQGVFKKLTLAKGATISVAGTINVSSRQNANNPYGGCVYGKYGQIHMLEGSSIIMQNGSNLYVWGYITGDGKVVAENGATIHESMQFTDFRGGNASSDFGTPANCGYVFPMQQYYIQNIESYLEMNYGAVEKVYSGISTGAGITATGAVTLITKSGQSGLFLLGNGAKLTRKYNATDDRQEYFLDGDVSLSSISLNVYITVNSANYVLPLTNNMSIIINSGTTSLSSNVSLLPGANITVRPDAIVEMADGKSIYVYDKDEWVWKNSSGKYSGYLGSGNAALKPLPYSPSKSNISTYRTADNLKDAWLDIQGTIRCTGSVYTTISKANVCCTAGKGRFELVKNAPADGKTYQAFQVSNFIERLIEIPVTSAVLHNWDDTYTATAGATAGANFYYVRGLWMHLTSPSTDCFYRDEQGHLFVRTDDFYEVIVSPLYPAAWQVTDCEDLVYIHTDATCAWVPTHTVAGRDDLLKGMEEEEFYQYNSDKGYWEIAPKWNVTFKNFNGKVLEKSIIYNGGTPTYSGYAPVKPTDDDGVYTFIGWSPEIGAVTADVEYIAQYSCTPHEASVTAYALTTYYPTVGEAITAANSKTDAVVTILQNATVTSEITISATMTIDLNGKTISATQASATGVFNINASGKTITIKDSGTGGKIDHTANYSGKLYGINFTAGSLDIIGGTIYAKNTTTANNSDYRAYGIYTSSSASAVTMSGGAIEAHTPNNPSSFGIYASNTCAFTMTGGTIIASGTSSVRGIYVQGTTNLSNNATITVTATGSECRAIFVKNGTMTIKGGTYTSNGTSNTSVIYFEAGTVTVEGGMFKGSTCEIAKRYTAYNVTLQGGVYVHETDLTAKCAENFYKFELTEAEKAEVGSEYNYKVAEAYTVDWTTDGDALTGSYTTGLIEVDAPIAAPNTPTKTGYTFDAWSPEFTGTMPSANTTYEATWAPNTNTPYVVKHFKQALDGSYAATPDETDNLTGTTATNVTPDRKSYEGFTSPAGETVSILADGSRVVEYKYTRNSYALSWETDGDDLTGTFTTGDTKYGASITAPNTPTKTGYTFAGWDNGTEVVMTPATRMPASALAYTATWTPNTNTPYVVKHFKQALDGSYAEHPDEIDNEIGTTATNVTPAVRDYTGFTAPATQTEAIAADGSLVITYKYTRNSDLLTWNLGGGKVTTAGTAAAVDETSPSGMVKFEAAIKAPEVEREGYNFISWDAEVAETMPATDVTYTAIWAKIVEDIEVGGVGNVEKSETIDETTQATTTIVHSDAVLEVEEESTLNTTTFIIEAISEVTDTDEALTTAKSESGEATGNIEADVMYFDLIVNNPSNRRWNAFTVPFIVDLRKSGHPIQINGETLTLGRGYDIVFYDGEERANNGKSAACWKYVEDPVSVGGGDSILYPGKAYMIASASRAIQTVRFTKATAYIPYDGKVSVAKNNGATDKVNGGWNGIGNPMMYHAVMNAGVALCQVHDGGEIGKDGYHTYYMTGKLVVGKAVFVQVDSDNDDVSIVKATSEDAAIAIQPQSAPRRTREQIMEERFDVQIALNGCAAADRVLILTEEDKEDKYVILKDLSKAGVSPVRTQMWVDRYGQKLCMNTTALINDKANYPLTISAPKAGEYNIFVNGEPKEDATLYLTYDGRAIWNLCYGGYLATLDKGTDTHYGLRIVRKAPTVTTGIEETTILNGDAVRKVVVDDKVFIIRNGEMYSITGQKVQ